MVLNVILARPAKCYYYMLVGDFAIKTYQLLIFTKPEYLKDLFFYVS